MNVLSLFDGMSCGQLALERAGIQVNRYFASEIKPHAIKVTQDNYPDTIQLGNVKNVSYKDEFIESENGTFHSGKIDLIINGSPCTNLSNASIGDKRTGLKGEQSGLFYEFVRILKEVQPEYFLLENVAGMKDEDKRIITDLLGVEPVLINSQLVTGQLRKRLYWTNIPMIGELDNKGIELQSVLSEGYTERKKARTLTENMSRPNIIPHKIYHRYVTTGFTTPIFKDQAHYEACKDHHTQYFKGLSAKQIDEKIEKENVDVSVYKGIRYFNKEEMEKLQTVPVGYTRSVTRNEAASLLGDGWTVDVIAHLLKGMEG